jgi:ArsR family transcriptional regulator, lead/cadmium/zinc/bismuth-responsive transcriptional repressor
MEQIQGSEHRHPVDPERVAKARERVPTGEEGDRLTGVLSLMADPTRARLLYALDVVEELCVGDLALVLDISEDAVSYGLRILRTAGLVTRRKEGRVVYYRLAEGFPEPLRQHCLRQLIEMSRGPEDEDEDAQPSQREGGTP